MEYLTIEEFRALKNNVSRTVIYNKIKCGKLEAVQLYGKTLIPQTPANMAWTPGSGNGRPRKLKKEAP